MALESSGHYGWLDVAGINFGILGIKGHNDKRVEVDRSDIRDQLLALRLVFLDASPKRTNTTYKRANFFC